MNALGCATRIFVLPNADNKPTCLGQRAVRLGIPGAISFKFLVPPGGVAFRTGTVLGASVPEASVYVDGYLQTCKHNVCAPPTFWNRRAIHAVAKAISVQDPSQGKLGSRVSSSLQLHAPPHCRRAGERRLSSLCSGGPARRLGPPVRGRITGVHGIGLPPRSRR
jgi:hypothetical protein